MVQDKCRSSFLFEISDYFSNLWFYSALLKDNLSHNTRIPLRQALYSSHW